MSVVRSTFVDLDGPVHVAEYGPPGPSGSTVVLLHGLGGSHVSWRGLVTALSANARVLAVDLPGHGRTRRLGRSSDVQANKTLLSRLLAHLGEPVTLVGHSMGAALAMLQAAAEPHTVESLALIAPPLPRAGAELPTPTMAGQVALCAVPWVARRALDRRLQRQGAAQYVRERLELTCADPQHIDAETLQLAIALVESGAAGPDASRAYVEAARSMGLLVGRASAYRRAIAAVDCPGVVVHGAADRLIRPAGLTQLRSLQPGWDVTVLDGVGHSPHLEAPDRTAALVRRVLAAPPGPPGRATPAVEAGAA
jgi:pimeloyl-ACP methyl ester carboxylesterase